MDQSQNRWLDLRSVGLAWVDTYTISKVVFWRASMGYPMVNMKRDRSHGMKFGQNGLFLVTTSESTVHKVVHGLLRVSWSTSAGRG